MTEPLGDQPLEGLSEAILDAARAASIGVALVALEERGPRVIWLNDAAVDMLGWSRDALSSSDPLTMLAPEELPRVQARLASRARGVDPGGSFETVVVTTAGERVPLQVAISPVVVGGARAVIAFFFDVRARKLAEQALRHSEERFRTLVESAPDSVVITRMGVVLYANPAAATLLGYESAAQMQGLRIDSLLDDEGATVMMQRTRAMLARGERFAPRDYPARRTDGTWVVAEITSHPIEHDGAPAILAFARDVTERNRLREQIARGDRLTALGTLAAGVAHEINNPLAYVTLGLEALRRHLEHALPDRSARAEALALLEPIRGGAARVGEIVRDLRTFSRPDDESMSEIVLRDVIAASERLVTHELRHRARLEVRIEGDPRVVGHTGRLEQVMVNLLVNAAQSFSGQSADPRVVVRCADRDGTVEIEVEDNGVGIPESVRGRVFDPFFTTKPAGVGTGLGLSICHGIVSRMGGEVALESVPSGGTLARVRLPSRPMAPAPVKSAAPPAAEDRQARRLRVLIVDDEPALGRALSALLASEHDVAVVTGGAEALARIAASRDAPPDVVLCDVMMPRMTGAELHARIEAEQPELAGRFVFMTGGAVTPRTSAFLAETRQPRLDKPFSAADLWAVLSRVGTSQPSD